MVTIGARIRSLRKARGLTQVQLAEKIGIQQGSYSDIETGATKEISGRVLAMLCRELHATPDFIMFGGDGGDDPESVLIEAEVIAQLRAMTPAERRLALAAVRGMAAERRSALNPFPKKPKTKV